MKESHFLIKKAQSVVEKYENELSAKGVRCSVTMRDYKRKGYKFRLSKYNPLVETDDPQKMKFSSYIVVKFLPIEKNIVETSKAKEYAFRVCFKRNGKVKLVEEEIFLFSLAKLIEKKIKKLGRKSIKKVCKNNAFDFLRYLFGSYDYMTSIMGLKISQIAIGIYLLMLIILSALIFVAPLMYK